MRYLLQSDRIVITQSDSFWERPYPSYRYKHKGCHLWGAKKSGKRWVPVFTSSYDGGSSIQVDYSMGRILARLAELGCTTLYCCSGLPSEHSGGGKRTGYIAFARMKCVVRSALTDDIYFDQGHNPCIRTKAGLSESRLRKAWRQFLNNLSP